MMKCRIASGFAFGYDPTGRSVFFKNNNDRIPYFDIRYSLFQSFLLIKLAVFLPAAALNPEP